MARINDLTGGLGEHSAIEAGGTQESMMQASRSTRLGGHVGYVGVAHDVGALSLSRRDVLVAAQCVNRVVLLLEVL